MSLDRSRLPTEQRHPASRELDLLTTDAAVAMFLAEERAVQAALELAQSEIVAAVDLIAARLADGGRLFYLGAGTSGRLAVLDAVECPPTFQSDPRLVQALIAGGLAALTGAVEGAEDDERAAASELAARNFCARDVLFGIAASGTTPYVRAGLAHARAQGAATILLSCVPRSLVPDDDDVSIRVVTGAELLTGSTRLKAGTATKLVLNTISTLVMVRLGKVHGNLMVALNTRGNAKLEDRGVRLVAELTQCDPAAASRWLAAADGQVQIAVLMQRRGLDVDAARKALASAGGSLRAALE
ncbi:MAG TPA: N-acetylmuramic acid 6-phosphate etherase [Planctomycetota bacterium]|nr:N-acetylmuramic acid 6-phosphate etherase [Planctomycetota bacterium]